MLAKFRSQFWQIIDFQVPYVHELKYQIKRHLFQLPIGRNVLDRESSIKILQNKVVYKEEHEPIDLPKLRLLDGVSTSSMEKGSPIRVPPDYVWEVKKDESIQSIEICAFGSTLLNKKSLLNLSFGAAGDILGLPYVTKQIEHPLIIAPWSHAWGGYYDFVALILSKLCRIDYALGREIWKEAKVCYPLRHSGFESQFLEKLGIAQDALIDSRKARSLGLEITTDCAILANNNSNILFPSPHDIQLLRNRFCFPGVSPTGRRFYLSRSGRRRVNNESEVRVLLGQFGFEILEDTGRTIDEQIRLFQEASIVVGPHGAGFTNLIWCSPGTRVIEFFYAGYIPVYFHYISKLLGLEYSYIADSRGSTKRQLSHGQRMIQDMFVDIQVLKKELERVLTN